MDGCGPEIARIVSEFEEHSQNQKEADDYHHVQRPRVQKSFAVDLSNTNSSFEKLENPFAEDIKHLYALDSKVSMPDEVNVTLRSIEEAGKTQFKQFMENRIEDTSMTFYDNIPRNNFEVFKSKAKKTSS